MSIGAGSTPIQAQSPRVAAHLVQNATNAVNTTPAGQGNLASAVMSAQALAAPAPTHGETASTTRGQPADTSGQPASTASAGASNATAAMQAPVAVAPGQESAADGQNTKGEEKSTDLPTEVVVALSGDDQGHKKDGEEQDVVDEVEEDAESLEIEFQEDDDASFAELLAQVEPAISAPGVRDIGTLYGRGKAAQAYGSAD
jgi:hypothetical protein